MHVCTYVASASFASAAAAVEFAVVGASIKYLLVCVGIGKGGR